MHFHWNLLWPIAHTTSQTKTWSFRWLCFISPIVSYWNQKFQLNEEKDVNQSQISLVNVATEGVSGTSLMKFSSSPASSNSTLNWDSSLKRFATTEPPDLNSQMTNMHQLDVETHEKHPISLPEPLPIITKSYSSKYVIVSMILSLKLFNRMKIVSKMGSWSIGGALIYWPTCMHNNSARRVCLMPCVDCIVYCLTTFKLEVRKTWNKTKVSQIKVKLNRIHVWSNCYIDLTFMSALNSVFFESVIFSSKKIRVSSSYHCSIHKIEWFANVVCDRIF